MAAPKTCPKCGGPIKSYSKGDDWIGICLDYRCRWLHGHGPDALANLSQIVRELGIDARIVVTEKEPKQRD